MSEIEIGEYVRTEYGISKLIEIRKVDGCEEQKIYIFDDISDELWSGDLPNELWKSETEWHEEKFNNKIFLKHSKQLIDLIEVGDYVNGREVKHIAMFEGFPDYPKLIFVDETHLIPDDTCENDEI
jgi:hypothetical protein